MKTPLVTIIVPCYNSERYIDKSLESVVKQTYRKWECIVVNDGSTDGSENKIKKWLLKDNRLKMISQKNSGPSTARNAGLKQASGECIFFLDSDDLLAPECLQSLINLYHPSIDIVIGKNAEVVGQTTEIVKCQEHYHITEKILRDVDFIELSLKFPISIVAWNKLYGAGFLKRNDLTFKDGVLHEDELWFFEIMHSAKRIIFNSKPTYYYNIGNEDSITKNFSLQHLKGYLKVIEHIYTDHYLKEENEQSKKVIGSYILNIQIMVLSVFFRFLKKNKVDYKSEGILLIKEHIETNLILDFSFINHKKSKQFKVFIKYRKVDLEITFKLIRNLNKENILKYFENIYLKQIARNRYLKT